MSTYRAARGLDRALFLKLAACDWIRCPAQSTDHRPLRRRQKLACLRPRPKGLPGGSVRRSIIACRVCSPPSRLLAADGRYAKLLRSLARVDLLILDDWGPEALTAEQRRDLLEIVEDRYDARSIMITSQVPVDRWYEIIGDPTIADAILDRLVHNAYRIELSGESLQKTTARRRQTRTT